MDNKKNLLIIGYGGMGSWHAERALKSDVVRLAGIYDIKPERRALAEQKGIKAYASREEALSDPSVEMVTVAVPNDMHEEIVIDALNHGKNALSEKPVTLSMDSLERMFGAAEKNHKVFSVHQNRRWDVDYLAMKQVSESGEIGQVINLESRIHGSRGIPSDWRGIKQYGGGMLYDWGVHLIDQALMILGWDPVSVMCRFDHITNQEVDDGFKLFLDYKDGRNAFIEVGTLNFLPMPRFYMRCRNGTALIRDWRENCQIAKCTHWHESEVLPVETAAGLTKTMAPRDSVTMDTYEIARPSSDVHDYYRNFCKVIDGKAELCVSHDQMRKVLQVILAAFRSVETGRPEPLV